MTRRTLVLVSIFSMILASGVLADEFWGAVSATADCVGDEVQLAVTFNNAEVEPEPGWIGWVVDRRVMGACVDDVQVTDVMPLPTVNGTIYVSDTLDISGLPALYYLKAVDAAGNRHQIYWPQRGWFVHAVCADVPAVRGVVRVENESFAWVQECPDQCWAGQSMFDTQLTPDLIPYEGQIVDVFGEVRLGMEGYYVIPTGWQISPNECGPVLVTESSWSAVKGRFR